MQLYLDSNLEKMANLVQWTEDNSLTVISENAIKAGNKTIGSNVETMFKKSYEATVLKIGEFLSSLCLNYLIFIGYPLSSCYMGHGVVD